MNDFTSFPIHTAFASLLPSLGSVTDGSAFIGLRSGLGQFSATAVRDYILSTISATRGVSVKDPAYGAQGDGVTDDTAAIQAALTANVGRTIFLPAGTYMVRDTGAGAGVYCLLNTGTSMRGEGRDTSVIVPMSSTSGTADIIKIKPPPGDENFLTLEHFSIFPGGSGSTKGKRAIYLDANESTSVSNFHVAEIECTPGNDYSFYMDNAPAVNLQGVPANSVIERCYFGEGMWFTSVGDSVTVRNCVMRTTAGSARNGVAALIQTGAGGTASHFIIEKCNMDCDGAAIWIFNGRNVKILHNNIESSFGAGSSSSAVVDLDGTSGAIVMPEIKGNAVGIFGTSTAATAIRCNATLEADIDNNTIIAGSVRTQAIALTSNATNTHVGFNEISSNFTTAVNNAGAGTRGVRISLTPSGGFTNVGTGYAAAAYWQAKDGTVTLEGLLACPATPNGLTLATLPAAARPLLLRRFPAYALVSASVAPQAVQIGTDGTVVYEGSDSATQVGLDGVVFTTSTGIAGGS